MIGLPAGSQVTDPIQLYVTTDTMVILFIAIVGATPVLPWIGNNVFFLNSDKNATDAPDLLWGAIQLQKTMLLGIIFVLCAVKLSAGTYNPFIYFRF